MLFLCATPVRAATLAKVFSDTENGISFKYPVDETVANAQSSSGAIGLTVTATSTAPSLKSVCDPADSRNVGRLEKIYGRTFLHCTVTDAASGHTFSQEVYDLYFNHRLFQFSFFGDVQVNCGALGPEDEKRCMQTTSSKNRMSSEQRLVLSTLHLTSTNFFSDPVQGVTFQYPVGMHIKSKSGDTIESEDIGFIVTPTSTPQGIKKCQNKGKWTTIYGRRFLHCFSTDLGLGSLNRSDFYELSFNNRLFQFEFHNTWHNCDQESPDAQKVRECQRGVTQSNKDYQAMLNNVLRTLHVKLKK
jgi:hypothetical protein